MKSIRTALRTAVCALVGVASIVPALAGNVDMTPQMKEAVLKDVERYITNYAFVPEIDFSEWPAMIAKRQDALDAAKTENEFVGVVNRALQEFGFSHIVLFGPTYAEQRSTNSMVGIGVRIQPEEDGLRVVWMFPEGPAGQAGIKVGDLIFEADGNPVRSTGDLRGDENTKTNVKVKRDGEILDFEVVRERFSTRIPETVSMLNSDTALVKIPTFDTAYDRKNVEEIMHEAMQADNIVLDLRGNGGGAVFNLLHLASFFLDREEAMGKFVSRGDLDRFKEENNGAKVDIVKVAELSRINVTPMPAKVDAFKGKVAVLIDAGTGSASEMMALALKEHRGSILLGQPSAGAVLASTMRKIEHNFMIQYPVMDYVSQAGYRIEGNGLRPSYTVAPPQFGEPDRAIELAQRWISGEIGLVRLAMIELAEAA